jgi:5-methyltetrahydropteroyltriglutamate--homocysteine methyltransferase
MCYSESGEIIGAIGDLDADVTSIEEVRSRMEFLGNLSVACYERGIGPGVWDIHSPRVPTVTEMSDALSRALKAVEPRHLWVNADCGLKTRGYAETETALRNLVAAARQHRGTLTR